MSDENFYTGTSNSLEPEYGELFSGYRVAASQIGLTTDPRTANQLQEVSAKVNPGGKVTEVSVMSPQIFESIPDQHLDEIQRLSKLTNTEISVHGPAIEPSGYTTSGGLAWSESNRQAAERQISSVVERSHKMDKTGNIPITFHPSYSLPETEELVKIGGKEMPKSILIVDPRTGGVGQIKEEERFFPGEKGKPFIPEEELARKNKESWDKALSDLDYYAMRGEEIVRRAPKILGEYEKELKSKGLSNEELKKFESGLAEGYANKEQMQKVVPEEFQPIASAIYKEYDHASIFLRESYNNLRELYNRVYKEANHEDKEKLNKFYNEIKGEVEKGIQHPSKIKEFADVIEKGINVLKSISNPAIYQPLGNFLIEKDAETFSNVALQSYKKFRDKSPVISIENPPAGTAISRAEDIKNLIETSRSKFVEKAVKEGMSKSQAEQAAEKLIGATWDVGHINMLRKYGYDKTDITKEAEKIAPFVKHIHLSDNFGFEHTELPMGMGNVPIKEIMQKLGKESDKVRKIVEAAQWYQFFKTTPLTETFEALGSPLYQMKSPYWNQARATYGSYSSGYGTMLPEQHFSIYGAGFSSLPTELGGQIPGKQSRLAGTPME